MNREQLRELLESKYSRNNWINLLATIFQSPRFNATPQNVLPQSEVARNLALEALELGTLETSEGMLIGVYEVKVNGNINIQKNRVGLRQLLRGQYRLIDGAFIAFHQGDKWRFSFVSETSSRDDEGLRIESKTEPKRYTFILGKGENCRTATERFEKLFGKWLSLGDIKEAFEVDKLTKDFYGELFNWYLWALKSVKFPQIRANEEDLIDDVVHQSESLIRLLTRLLFIWFMKEKGLVSSNLFKKEFVKSKIKGFKGDFSDETLYYKAILQNLFFATLNKPIEERQIIDNVFPNQYYGDPLVYRYVELFNSKEEILPLFENIPFLNGGLFDCLDKRKDEKHHNEIRLDGFSQHKSKQPVVPDMLFFGEYTGVDLSSEYDDKRKNKVTVHGLIDILSRYNFTIEENTPLDVDVALDPELLGKVFENLLASYNPETQTTARKQTGSFYTPREIVNYMVDESLIVYLIKELPDNNNRVNEIRIRALVDSGEPDINPPFTASESKQLIKALNRCKVLDPACGSGAFPMGILQKMIHILRRLDPENKIWFDMVIDNFPSYMKNEMRQKLKEENWDYVRKLGVIQECIYGIDIQPIAIQISKLRFFISLLVDQTEKPNAPNRGFEPLPNLDFKFAAANTLIAAPDSDTIQTGLFVNAEDPFFERFDNLTEKFFTVSKPEEKKILKDQIEDLIEGKCKVKQGIINGKTESNDERVTNALKKKHENYIVQQQRDVKLWKSYTNLFKHEAVGFFETRYFFPKVNDGFNIIIGNPPYIAFQRMEVEMRKVLQSLNYKTFESTGDIYTLFYERGLQLLKEKGTLSYITSRQWMQASYGKSLRRLLSTEANPIELIDFGQTRIFEGATVFVNILLFEKNKNKNRLEACQIPTDYDVEHENLASFFEINKQEIKNLTENTWAVSNSQHINEQIEKIGKPLEKWEDIEFFRGITSGLNEAFHIEEQTKTDLIKRDSKNKEIIKPLLRGKDIKRYSYDFNNWYTLFIPWHFPLHLDKTIANSSTKAEVAFQKEYPAIYNHLLQYKTELANRNQAETCIRYEWYALQRYGADFWENFEKPKIVWIEISDRANYAYDDKGMYLTNSAYFLTCKNDNVNLKYLLAILNSKVADFYFSKKTARIAGGRMRYTKQYVELIPVPEISKEKQKPFIALVNIILFLKNQHLEDKTDRVMSFFFEHVIDVAVAELYFKDQINQIGFEISIHLQNIPDNEKVLSLGLIRKVYNELNGPNHPILSAVSFLKNHEPFKLIEETLNRKD